MPQLDLFVTSREHDLPPKWDGNAVLWSEWGENPFRHAFICPPPRERRVCPRCGSIEDPVYARGMVAQKRSTDVDRIRRYKAIGRPGEVAPWRLFAFRCVDCRHDQVYDMHKSEWWDLDPNDYGDDGSVDPEGRW